MDAVVRYHQNAVVGDDVLPSFDFDAVDEPNEGPREKVEDSKEPCRGKGGVRQELNRVLAPHVAVCVSRRL